MGWIGYKSYTAVTPRASLQSDANNDNDNCSKASRSILITFELFKISRIPRGSTTRGAEQQLCPFLLNIFFQARGRVTIVFLVGARRAEFKTSCGQVRNIFFVKSVTSVRLRSFPFLSSTRAGPRFAQRLPS